MSDFCEVCCDECYTASIRENDTLRAQLAEAKELLREHFNSHCIDGHWCRGTCGACQRRRALLGEE